MGFSFLMVSLPWFFVGVGVAVAMTTKGTLLGRETRREELEGLEIMAKDTEVEEGLVPFFVSGSQAS